jgi:ADP-heptose:LPS heptosyltransferase
LKKKILLIRLDKIGDLICTLPVDQVLDSNIYDITWVIQKGLNKILDLGENKRRYIELDKNNIDLSRKNFADFLKQNSIDIAISFQCPWWVNFELFKARIPKRIGVLSQWHSFLFLNQGLRQKRSQAFQHEFDYNLDLVKKITGPLSVPNKEILFQFKKPTSSEVISKFNLDSGGYVVVHPGMMGSALNWPQKKYIEYIQRQLSHNKKVVVTGTDADTPYLLQIKAQFESHPQVIWLQSKLNFEELIQVLYYSEKVIAPSTGVAHIAASLGKVVECIFSPVRVHHPTRWAPRGTQVTCYLPKGFENPIDVDKKNPIDTRIMERVELP